MDAATKRLVHGAISERVIGAFFDTYNELGYGFLESVYEAAFAIRLQECGLRVEQQVPIAVRFHNHLVGEFRADLIVEERLLIEVKAINHLTPAHDAQLLNYLKATNMHLGLLMNFGPRPEFRRRMF